MLSVGMCVFAVIPSVTRRCQPPLFLTHRWANVLNGWTQWRLKFDRGAAAGALVSHLVRGVEGRCFHVN